MKYAGQCERRHFFVLLRRCFVRLVYAFVRIQPRFVRLAYAFVPIQPRFVRLKFFNICTNRLFHLHYSSVLID